MKNAIWVLFILGVLTSCSQKTFETLEWQNNKVVADGKINEWANPLRFYDHNSKINYAISNDRQNLYVCMKISDETMLIKILRGGMEFRIDTLGKKTFPIALLFPLPGQQMMLKDKKNGMPSEKSYGEKQNPLGYLQNLINQIKTLQLVGFKPPNNGTQSLLNISTGISAAVNMDSLGIMYYEAIIPFKTFYKNELSIADTGKVFNYEIIVNALPSPKRESGNEGDMGGGSGMGGSGHRGGGGMYGGGRGAYGEHNSGNSEMFESNKIIEKMKFSIK
ncbi:MAG: hypothetical protein WCH34_11450 [Bacteroidota bacterium]